MSSQLARLRMLGKAVGEEVESQNEMLDRIQVKAERTNVRVQNQDKQVCTLYKDFLYIYEDLFTVDP